MMRKCHLNTCPVGVATQDPVLRKKFAGKPEHVVNFFFFVAEEARQIMAQLGIRKFDDLIGRADLLDTKKGIAHWKARGLDFSRIFHQPQIAGRGAALPGRERRTTAWQRALDVKLIESCRPAIERGEKVQFMEDARNVNRTRRRDALGRADPPAARRTARPDHLHPARRHGGQSFGAFLANGITLYLIGDANDYTGKGLSGGRIVVRPSIEFRGDATQQHHHRQHRAVRRHQRRGLLPRRGRRAFRGAPVGRHRGGRRHRRPRLRVHDRRHRGRARQDRAQLRRRHERRRGLRLRRGRPVRAPLQHQHGDAGQGAGARGSRPAPRSRLAPRVRPTKRC